MSETFSPYEHSRKI